MCFDKTGTLTEEGLEMYGVRPICYDSSKFLILFITLLLGKGIKQVKFAPLQKSIEFKIDDLEILLRKPKELPSIMQSSKKSRSQLLVEVLASCHSLMLVKGELVGDPLDIKMFQFSGWTMEQNEV